MVAVAVVVEAAVEMVRKTSPACFQAQRWDVLCCA